MNSPLKTERFEMRFEQSVIENIDAWRSQQSDMPSRAEAIRRLIEIGMVAPKLPEIKFSDGEKLTISMLCGLYEHLKIKDDVNYKLVNSAILGGHNWALGWDLQGIFHGHQDSKQSVNDVVDALDMWSFIEMAHAKFSQKEKDRIANEVGPLGKHVKFTGFDGNYEGEHYSIASFMVNDMERFTEFKKRDLNSHVPMVARYRRMYKLFEPMRVSLVGRNLNASEIIELLKAQN